MSSAEGIAIDILKEQGFENIMRPIGPPTQGTMMYDFNAEKNGVKYGIEVKGTDEGVRGRFTVPCGQLREMAWRFIIDGRKPLLIFIDLTSSKEFREYYIFEMKRTKIGVIKYPFK